VENETKIQHLRENLNPTIVYPRRFVHTDPKEASTIRQTAVFDAPGHLKQNSIVQRGSSYPETVDLSGAEGAGLPDNPRTDIAQSAPLSILERQ
jgi:hypothetical protein